MWGAVDDDFEDDSDEVDDWFSGDDPRLSADDEDTPPAPAPAPVVDDFEAKVQDALTKIPAVLQSGWDKSLALYISKNVTAARRDAWREARRRTGIR